MSNLKEFSRRARRSGEYQFIVKKRRRIVFVGLLVAVFAVMAWLGSSSLEPRHQGRKLSNWLRVLTSVERESGEEQQRAMVAVKHIGPAAIPFLIEMLRVEDSPVKQDLVAWLEENVGWQWKVSPASEWRECAVAGFAVLGRSAEPAIPALACETTNLNLAVAREAWRALLVIDSTNCVSVLIQGLTNANTSLQAELMIHLASAPHLAQAVVPMLLTKLTNSDLNVRIAATHAFGSIWLEPETVAPALLARLADSDTNVRLVAAERFGVLGSASAAATTALQAAQRDSNKAVRAAATRSLLRLQCETRDGGIVRGPRTAREIALVFTGHEYAEGGETILDELKKHRANASFFLTGDFISNAGFAALLQRMIQDRHFVGPHSDRHLLYCAWEDPAKTLVTKVEFWFDLGANLAKLERLGVDRTSAACFLPPFEHYNRDIALWALDMGLTLINFTPGTRSNADYTGEADTNFVSSQAIFDSIVQKEREDPHGLNGFILLFHLGSGSGRKDKFHYRFGELLDYLAGKGYQFVRVDELLEPKPEEKLKSESPQSPTESRPGDVE